MNWLSLLLSRLIFTDKRQTKIRGIANMANEKTLQQRKNVVDFNWLIIFEITAGPTGTFNVLILFYNNKSKI